MLVSHDKRYLQLDFEESIKPGTEFRRETVKKYTGLVFSGQIMVKGIVHQKNKSPPRVVSDLCDLLSSKEKIRYLYGRFM